MVLIGVNQAQLNKILIFDRTHTYGMYCHEVNLSSDYFPEENNLLLSCPMEIYSIRKCSNSFKVLRTD